MDNLEFEFLKKKIMQNEINIRIITDSMVPIVRINEQVSMTKLPEVISVFDIIVFFDDGKLICHFAWKDQRAFNGTIITRSLKEPYKNELPRKYDNILGWVPSKKIPWGIKTKLIILNWIRGAL